MNERINELMKEWMDEKNANRQTNTFLVDTLQHVTLSKTGQHCFL